MAFIVRFPLNLLEKTCPRSDFLKSQEAMEALTATLSTAFNLSTWLHQLEQADCRFCYVDISKHPFILLGDAYSLWGIGPKNAPVGQVPEADILKLNLPFSDEAIETLKEEAAWFGLSADQPEDVVPAMLNLLAAMQAYDSSIDGKMIKPVIRGLHENIEALAAELPLDGFAGVVDTPGSVDKDQVWGLEDEDKPEDVPTLVLFEAFVEDDPEAE